MALSGSDLCTLNDVKTRLGIALSDTSKDTLIEDAIMAASGMIADYCDRTFEYDAAIVENVAGHGTAELIVSRPPIKASGGITSIKYDGDTLDADSYSCVGRHQKAGVIQLDQPAYWTTRQGAGSMRNGVAGHEELLYEVTYAGGYVTPSMSPVTGVENLPRQIRQACITQALYLYALDGRDPAVSSERLLSYGVTYKSADDVDPESGLLKQVAAMVSRFKHLAQA
jgi:hypothetical protein